MGIFDIFMKSFERGGVVHAKSLTSGLDHDCIHNLIVLCELKNNGMIRGGGVLVSFKNDS